mmetsp:Transcript_5798/g.8208  ORF Transcript_5798/g.8208 Transcript_5798/m.8208 type:complete len:126 (+) Transcript_5798:120-497(+)
MSAQEDGAYPRLNAEHMNSGQYVGNIVSLVGCVESFDGSIVQFKCADGGVVNVMADSEFAINTGGFAELIGAVNEDNTLQLFVTRELPNDMDLEVYNQMLVQVIHNPKFAEYGFVSEPVAAAMAE